MSSKDLSLEEGIEIVRTVSLDDGSKQRRKPSRVFRQYSSGEFFASDADTVDSLGPFKKQRYSKTKNLYASPKNTKNKAQTADDESLENDEPSHLTSLVRLKKSVNKYANRLVRKQSKKKYAVAANTSSQPMVDMTPAEVDGTTKASNSLPPLVNDKTLSASSHHSSIRIQAALTKEQKEEAEKASKGILLLQEAFRDYSHLIEKLPIEIRVDNLKYSVPYTEASSKIETVYNSSFVYKAVKKVKELTNRTNETKQAVKTQTKYVLDGISLCLKPGKMYLVMGPPGSGKSSLLKAIAGRLYHKGEGKVEGSVTYNGKQLFNSKGFHHENSISLIDQLDRHAPLYTVEETLNFAFRCKRRNGSHIDFRFQEDTEENRELAKRADDNNLLVDTFMKILGIDHVKDTFVGNDEIRGVSGGQRRRVTIGEMLMSDSPIICGDEISNGLDSGSTFEIITAMSYIGRVREKLQVISLLQPSPEIVALFDEIILMANGKIIYAGPVLYVENYFAALGYIAPMHMDVGDFLQIISTPDGAELYNPPPNIAEERPNAYTLDELAEEFYKSQLGNRINYQLKTSNAHIWGSDHGSGFLSTGDLDDDDIDVVDDRNYKAKYQNNFVTCFWLNLKRQLTLWRRDKRVLITNAIKNFVMGISVGGVFFQTTDEISILGVLFQSMLFVMLGGMVSAPAFVDERLIYYKQNDANYYGAFPFIFAKAISRLPQTIMDCFVFGTILYYMVGFAPQPLYYFTFMGVVVLFNVLMSEFLFIFATFAATRSMVQIFCAIVVFVFMLFCGFLIPPVTIPSYFRWLYWYNPLAWAYRALVVNAFRNDEYTTEEADEILQRAGFVYNDDVPFDREWIIWAFIFMALHIFVSVLTSAMVLASVRVHPKAPPSLGESIEKDEKNLLVDVEKNGEDGGQDVDIPFKPITLSFENVCYDVKTSTGDEDIRLLHNINGYFQAGRMCALMGESGAGKTTLMDVIAMRKNSGTVKGDIRINGFPQDKTSFRRCSGYVEQFDIQSPQLTVRETVLFSARLRLDSNRVKTDEEKEQFCDTVIRTLELSPFADCLVGSNEEGGLSFEQRKRLSIAVELAASPSIIFLDEPTTGLDARSASLVVKLLRKIADQGRTICATVHQPSSAVFDMFDDLLLLRKGGHSVYFGELGFQCETMIKYFEGHGATKIMPGDNPANWMLRIMQKCDIDFPEIYLQDPEYTKLKHQLAAAREDPPEEHQILYLTEYAVPRSLRQKLTNMRLQTIYWRSPAYNLSRLMVCGGIAFILGSVFVAERKQEVLTENQVSAYFSITYLSFIIIGIMSIITVLPVMLAIRNVFYKQFAAGMIDNTALGWALGFAEMGFIVLSSLLFSIVYLATARTFPFTFFKAFKFWGFFTFNIAIYSYFGQAFTCLVPTMATAQILCTVFIGLNNIFSGLIIRPQFMKNIFGFTYWITPGHYVFEGLILSQYWGDQRAVEANAGSDFYDFLGCDQLDPEEPCEGTVEQYVWVFFGTKFNQGNIYVDILVLGLVLILARVATFFALRKFHYTNT